MQYTAGPWLFDRGLIISLFGDILAELPCRDEYYQGNGRLMASSPEMYIYLKKMIYSMEEAKKIIKERLPDYETENWEKILKEAREVINIAENS
ncbi:MAG: hypothetical protein ABRQ37_00635 [Candidatus Eremiobacterota bacterium]